MNELIFTCFTISSILIGYLCLSKYSYLLLFLVPFYAIFFGYSIVSIQILRQKTKEQ